MVFFLVRSINCSYNIKSLSNTQKQGLITCIPKGNKSKHYLKNWRPISLLNVEYKIASACIAERIKTVLPKLINEDQTGFMQGRYIGENIRLIYDLLNYTEEKKEKGMVLLVDFEKAFDSVSWSFIKKVLKYFNFGPSLQTWVEIFYNNIPSCIQVNGHITEWFQIQRGCRQGDPLSPYICLLCAEILAILARNNKHIKGITINDIIYLISQYADDTTFILDGSKQSLEETLKLLRLFAQISGLSINMEKTKVIWIGRNKNSQTRYCREFNLEWNPKTFTLLGVKFSVNIHEMISINYEDKLLEIKNLLSHWSKRNLTPVGRITVIKSLALSKLNHLFAALPNPPDNYIQTLNRLFFKFIWQKSPEKIKRTVLCKDYKEGGFRMVNTKTFIQATKVSWIRRTIQSNSKWVQLHKFLYPDMNVMYYGTSVPDKYIKNQTNKFWKDVFISWNTFVKTFTNDKDICKESLWLNNNIKIDGKTVFFKSWFNKGIRIVNDVLDDLGFISYDSLRTNFGVETIFLTYHSLIMAIKKYLISINLMHISKSSIEQPFISPILHSVIQYKKGCRIIYDKLNECTIRPKSILKWERDIRKMPLSVWKYYFSLPFKISKDSKLWWFQGRIVHRILTTNKFLFIINRRHNDLCSFCNLAPETIIHLFWECQEIQNLWEDISIWLNFRNLFPDLEITSESIIFGFKGNTVMHSTLNLIFLVIKYMIYKSKVQEKHISLPIVKNEISNRYKLEKYIATINNKLGQFEERWKNLSEIIIRG